MSQDELPKPATARLLLNDSDDVKKAKKGLSTKNNVEYSARTVFQVVSFYWVTSISIVFLNKFIFTASEYKFPFPVFVTWFQLVVAMFLLVTCGQLGKSVSLFSRIPPFRFNKSTAKEIFPLTFVYVMMLTFNNLCLRDVEVTFYQVARSLTILFQIVLTYAVLGNKTSRMAILACLVVFVGFLLGSIGEANFSWKGIIYGITSSFFVALYGIYVKKTLKIVENDEWVLLHYNTAISCVLLFPFTIFFHEFPALLEVHFLGDMNFWAIMTLTAVTGFLINIAMFLQIKVTSPLTNTISGTAKACTQTILAWMIFRNEITPLNGLGIFISLLGSAFYSYVRYRNL